MSTKDPPVGVDELGLARCIMSRSRRTHLRINDDAYSPTCAQNDVMGFRFHRSIKILPGIRINQGKRSASLSLGGRGAHVTMRPGHKMRVTVGLPGTGSSFTEGGNVVHAHASAIKAEPTPDTTGRDWLLAALALTVILCIVLNNLG